VSLQVADRSYGLKLGPQHLSSMRDQVLSLFEFKPGYDLDIMQNRQSFELDNCSDPARGGRDYPSIEARLDAGPRRKHRCHSAA
jgi:hypothetical protein